MLCSFCGSNHTVSIWANRVAICRGCAETAIENIDRQEEEEDEPNICDTCIEDCEFCERDLNEK